MNFRVIFEVGGRIERVLYARDMKCAMRLLRSEKKPNEFGRTEFIKAGDVRFTSRDFYFSKGRR